MGFWSCLVLVFLCPWGNFAFFHFLQIEIDSFNLQPFSFLIGISIQALIFSASIAVQVLSIFKVSLLFFLGHVN